MNAKLRPDRDVTQPERRPVDRSSRVEDRIRRRPREKMSCCRAAEREDVRVTLPMQRSRDEWQHESIRLEPLNPDFEAFDLAPDVFESRYRVIAEFVQVLD